MHVEWAVNCGTITEAALGYDLTTAGVTGYIASGDEIPCDMLIHALVCFRCEPTDWTGVVYDFWTEVIGPDGEAQPRVPFRVMQGADTSPQLTDIERHFMPLTILVTVTTDGQYAVVFGDSVSHRYEMPIRVSVLSGL